MLEEISLQLMRTSSNAIRRGNIGTHHSSKEQASSHANKDGKEYAKHHIPGQKSKQLGKRKNKGYRGDNSEDGSVPGQGTSAGYEIIDAHCVSPHGNPAKGKYLDENRETLERRTRRPLEGNHLAEDSAR